jgi:hypothetical protein
VALTVYCDLFGDVLPRLCRTYHVDLEGSDNNRPVKDIGRTCQNVSIHNLSSAALCAQCSGSVTQLTAAALWLLSESYRTLRSDKMTSVNLKTVTSVENRFVINGLGITVSTIYPENKVIKLE